MDDSVLTPEDAPVTLNPISNDTDIDNDTLRVTGATEPSHGTVALNANGTITYVPARDFFGMDSFAYTVTDGHGGTATATIFVEVTPVNDAPVAGEPTPTVAEDTTAVIALPVSDIDNTPAELTCSLSGPAPAHGSVTFTGCTAYYVPAADYNGPDTFQYIVNDGHGGTAIARVDIKVTPVNDRPVAVADVVATNEDTPLTIDAAANDTDIDGDKLTVVSVSQPTLGSASVVSGKVDYVPTRTCMAPRPSPTSCPTASSPRRAPSRSPSAR